jgi:murein L,D-transpeptidase YafK
MDDPTREIWRLMFFIARIRRPGQNRRLLSSILAVSFIASAVGLPAIADAKQDRTSKAAAQQKPDAESLLIEVYKELSANRLRKAMAKADRLVLAYPNFRLGHLIRGDLLLMHGHPVTTLGAVTNGPADRLKDLREEAMVRLKSLRERPDPGLMPRAVLQLRTDQKHVLLVDAKRSRLYVYENQDGGLKLVTDYYVTQGKSGIHKLKEGDQKTPVGVYYITSRLSGPRLPDFYGSGALTINYPNEWDRANGRGGSGIWLHGTSSDNFSRPPLASDGCVVLANPDLSKLYGSVDVGKTPVVIAEEVEFISTAKWHAERGNAQQVLETWRRDIESADTAKLMSHYSARFKAGTGENLQDWFGKQKRFGPGRGRFSVELKDVSQFYYPGRDNLLVSTFTQTTTIGRTESQLRKRQYWAKEGAQWKIIYEGHV